MNAKSKKEESISHGFVQLPQNMISVALGHFEINKVEREVKLRIKFNHRRAAIGCGECISIVILFISFYTSLRFLLSSADRGAD